MITTYKIDFTTNGGIGCVGTVQHDDVDNEFIIDAEYTLQDSRKKFPLKEVLKKADLGFLELRGNYDETLVYVIFAERYGFSMYGCEMEVTGAEKFITKCGSGAVMESLNIPSITGVEKHLISRCLQSVIGQYVDNLGASHD